MTNNDLTTKAMLAALTIRQWSGAKHDKRVSADVAARYNAQSSDVGRYSKYLVSPTALRQLKSTANDARTEHYYRTLPWSDNGQRILSGAGYFDYCKTLRVKQRAWEVAQASFFIGWESYVDEARRSLGDLYNADDYPLADRLRDKFQFSVSFAPLPDAEDFRVSLSNDEVERIKGQITTDQQSAVQQAMKSVWERLRAVVQHMSDRLKLYGVGDDGSVKNPFRDTLVTNVRQLLTIVPTLNLTADPDITAFCTEIGEQLTVFTAAELREIEPVRQSTAKHADAILAKMEAYL